MGVVKISNQLGHNQFATMDFAIHALGKRYSPSVDLSIEVVGTEAIQPPIVDQLVNLCSDSGKFCARWYRTTGNPQVKLHY